MFVWGKHTLMSRVSGPGHVSLRGFEYLFWNTDDGKIDKTAL